MIIVEYSYLSGPTNRFVSELEAITIGRESGAPVQISHLKLAYSPCWGQSAKLLALPNAPTAIFCATDEMAMGCLHAVSEAGLDVPGDISVMGFDDNRYAKITNPPLTTVSPAVDSM